jgi:hypothetical protein
MELTVKTLLGVVRLTSLPENITVEALKAQLSSSLRVPPPEEQNLVRLARFSEPRGPHTQRAHNPARAWSRCSRASCCPMGSSKPQA